MIVELAKVNKWFYRIIGGNGQTMLTSQTYATRWNAKRAAKKFAAINNLEYREA